jgi:quercetin dioxygenase-like cupin family protein
MPKWAGMFQLRFSPLGYQMDFHPTVNPQWTFVLAGSLEIGLQDGSVRVFHKGDFFYSEDTVPTGATF